MKKKFCEQCKLEIDEKEQYTVLGTMNQGNPKKDYMTYFHFRCWVEYFNDRVSKKAKSVTANMQNQVMELVNNPSIKGMLSDVKGIDKIMSMLSVPLTEQKIKDIKEDLDGKTKQKHH